MWRALLARLRSRRPARPDAPDPLVPWRPRPGPPKIDVAGVGHRFGRRLVALRDVNVQVHAGEFVCLLGPSGCGKTTLLYALAGHLAPSGGRIEIDGVLVHGPGPERLLVFQEPALFPWMTAERNVAFPLLALGLPRAAAAARARDHLARVGLAGFERARPHELSGGMRQRVQLARALALDPAVLLMDEPFAALDAQTRTEMQALLQEIWLRDRKTVVFVTHDVREALVLGDRVIAMAPRPGRVLQDLEVRLPRPRDPDDETIVRLSRRIRAALREAEAAAPGGGAGGEEVAHGGGAGVAGGGVRGGAPPRLGAPLPGGAVAPLALPRAGAGRPEPRVDGG
jgi:NitT/TauT family transport system ATP-binding protein